MSCECSFVICCTNTTPDCSGKPVVTLAGVANPASAYGGLVTKSGTAADR